MHLHCLEPHDFAHLLNMTQRVIPLPLDLNPDSVDFGLALHLYQCLSPSCGFISQRLYGFPSALPFCFGLHLDVCFEVLLEDGLSLYRGRKQAILLLQNT